MRQAREEEHADLITNIMVKLQMSAYSEHTSPLYLLICMLHYQQVHLLCIEQLFWAQAVWADRRLKKVWLSRVLFSGTILDLNILKHVKKKKRRKTSFLNEWSNCTNILNFLNFFFNFMFAWSAGEVRLVELFRLNQQRGQCNGQMCTQTVKVIAPDD